MSESLPVTKYSVLNDLDELRAAYSKARRLHVVGEAFRPRRSIWTWALYLTVPVSAIGLLGVSLVVFEIISAFFMIPFIFCTLTLPFTFHKVLGVVYRAYRRPGSRVIMRQGLRMTATRYFMFRQKVEAVWQGRTNRLEKLLEVARSNSDLESSVFGKHLITVVLVTLVLAMLNGGARRFWMDFPMEAIITSAYLLVALLYVVSLSWMLNGLFLTAAYREREFVHFLSCLSVDLEFEEEAEHCQEADAG